jgi:UDP-glucose:(heptosyl)LPS alpha-1,3-glucosyltransferase
MEMLARGDEKREMRGWFRGHYGVGEGEKVAVFVGHDFRRKGLRYAIEAVGRTKDWKLVVVGLGKVREYVELAEGLGLGMGGDVRQGDTERSNPPKGGTTNRVMFIGPTREMGAVYAAGDALILPAFYEPSNVVVLEALAAGLPVVSTVFLGMAEEVARAQVGVVVPEPGDVEGLARGLKWIGGMGAAEREALAKRARGVVAGYSAKRFADRLEGMYGEVMGK